MMTKAAITSLTAILVACASLAMAAGTALAASLTITPTSVAANYTGTIALDITGLASGQTVLVETFLDINGNGTIDSGDLLVQSFQVTDGQALTIGGVRDTNVPGDEDGLADGKIHTLLNFARSGHGFDAATMSVAKFIYQVSPVTAAFTITQPVYAQKVVGQVTSGGSAVPYAFTFLIDPAFNGAPIIMALADASGNFTLNAAPGSYAVFALDAGFVADSSAAPVVTVNTGATVPQNLSLTAADRTIAGRLTDLGSGAGIPGVLISAKSSSGLLAVGFSDASGNFAIPVSSASTKWKLDPSEQSLALAGYLALNGKYPVDISGGSVSGVSIQLPKATALIYGTLKDDQGNPLAGVDIYADTDQYEGYGLTDSAGNYVVGVTAGTWNIGPDSDELTALGYLETGASVNVTDGQALQQDFIAQHFTAYLSGQLVDTMDNGVGNIGMNACPQGSGNCSGSTTNSDGTFSIGVFGGTWNLSFSSDDLANQNLIGPQLPFTVTDGVNQTGIVAVALAVTSSITGTVQDSNGNPITNLEVYASANISGTEYFVGSASGTETNNNGNYALGVANGTWQVGLDCNGLNSRGLPCVSEQSVTVPSQNQTVNFTVPLFTAYLMGQLVDTMNNGVGNIGVSACPQVPGNCSNSTTNSDGTFSIGVFGGTWNLGFSSSDLANQNLIGPQLQFTVTDGVNRTGIVAVALAVTSSITGTVQESNGNPITNLFVYAFATINGTQYNVGGQTNNNGQYAFGVANGTWQVGLNCGGDNGLNSLGLPCVSNQSVTVPSQNQTVNFTVPVPCVGDCNGNGQVTIDDILTMVDIALGNVDVSACLAGDANHDGQITVDEILRAVNAALRGCAVSLAEQGCLTSGGTVTSAMCCTTTGDFPNTCAIGACGCPPDASHEVRTCNCLADSCFDGSACVPR